MEDSLDALVAAPGQHRLIFENAHAVPLHIISTEVKLEDRSHAPR